MFGFLRKKPAPEKHPANPGVGVEAQVAFSRGRRTWTEKVDVVRLAADVLRDEGHSVSNEKTWLRHKESGFSLQPLLVELQPLDDGGVRTVTTVQVDHPDLPAEGLFEYQHSAGESMADALSKGFAQWARMDLVTLLEALRPEPRSCTAMTLELPARGRRPARFRRAVLGPVAHFMQHPGSRDDAEEEHPFCPCCLLTQSMEAFMPSFEGSGTYGIRLFAARDEDGGAHADCRVNGEDFEEGALALQAYARTWPEAGYEFRKQYVVLQDVPGPAVR